MLRIAELYGQCLPIPEMCPTVMAPVCGCDGETYDNQCNAAANGVSVASEGECTGTTPCTNYGVKDDTCSDNNQFCRIGEGDCMLKIAEQDGFCQPQPVVCDLSYDPVCGCDGEDYANECNAFAAGVNVQQKGEC